MNHFYRSDGKRLIDLLVAFLLLIVFSPVMLLIGILVGVRLGPPVLFKQRRAGRGGRPFLLIKFRTMTDDRDADGQPLPDERRLTRFGKFLRSTSLDELPELWNVVRGEMSLVGPRPLLVDYCAHYSPRQVRRHEVRPGLTGLAQVRGRNSLSWAERFEYDVRYAENVSLLLDVWILTKTVVAVLRRDGVAAASHATMPRFAPAVVRPQLAAAGQPPRAPEHGHDGRPLEMTMNDTKRLPRAPLLTEEVGCAFCGSLDVKRLFTERYELDGSATDLGINRCRNCDLVYVSPRLTAESTRQVYELDASQTISNIYCWDGSTNERRFDALLKRLAKLANRGRLLDVGCGGGHFLRAARRTGLWHTVGVEPIVAAAEQAKRYADCEVRQSTLEEANFAQRSFDVITLLGVLEHLHDPIGVLRLARDLLKDDGVLAVYVPNFNYLRLKDTGPVCYARTGRRSKLHPQEHLYQYTPRTLLRILQACRYEVLRVDVGKPFAQGRRAKRILKEAAYVATCALKMSTGIHLGGLEVIARAAPTATGASEQPTRRRRAA